MLLLGSYTKNTQMVPFGWKKNGHHPASILYKSIAGCYRPVSYPDGPITARYRFIKNAYWAELKIQNKKSLNNIATWASGPKLK